MSMPISIRNLILAALAFVVVLAAPLESQSNHARNVFAGNSFLWPGSRAEQQAPVDRVPAVDDPTLSTSDWTEWQLNLYSIRVPSAWQTPEDLLADEDYWREFSQANGKASASRQRERLEQMQQDIVDGDLDLALIDPMGSGSLLAVPLGYMPPSCEVFHLRKDAYFFDAADAEIVMSELGTQDSGFVYHVLITYGNQDPTLVADMYYVQAGDNMVLIELDMAASDSGIYLPYGLPIAQSLVENEDSKR